MAARRSAKASTASPSPTPASAGKRAVPSSLSSQNLCENTGSAELARRNDLARLKRVLLIGTEGQKEHRPMAVLFFLFLISNRMICFGQWRQTKPFLVRKEAMREYRFLIPSFRAQARNLFRLRSRRNRRVSENGKRRTPYTLGSRRFIREGNSERSTKSSLGGVYEERLFVIAMFFSISNFQDP